MKMTLQGDVTLRKQLRAVRLPASKKRQLFFALGRSVIKTSTARTRAQREIDGSAMAPAANGKKRVLKKIMKTTRVLKATEKGATVGWPNNLTGKIARAQQEGITQQHTAASAKRAAKRRGEPDYSAPATSAQATALLDAGYKRYSGRYKSGQKSGAAKGKRVSKKWITENLTMGQAGLILRILREKDSKQTWQTKTPARPFFGVNRKEIPAMSQKIINEITTNARKAGA